MKVHYESVLKALDKAIRSAEEQRRSIDYIELSWGEWFDLDGTLRDVGNYSLTGLTASNYKGVRIQRAA